MQAKDIMTTDVISVSAEEKVEKVATLLVENKISGIPVVDERHHVIGIITENDLILKAGELKVPFYLTLFDSIIFLENPMKFNTNLKKYTASQVKDAMTEKVLCVEENMEMTKIVNIMQDNEINRVPVVKDGKLVGIITRNDILKALVKQNG